MIRGVERLGGYDFGMRRRGVLRTQARTLFPGEGRAIAASHSFRGIEVGKSSEFVESAWRRLQPGIRRLGCVWDFVRARSLDGRGTGRACDHAGDSCKGEPHCQCESSRLNIAWFLCSCPNNVVTLGDQVFNRYHIILVWGVFAVVTWATILIGFPFTHQLVRESAQREVWSEPLFHRVHLRLTTVWGIIFTLDTALAVVALGGSYVRMVSEIIPGASMIFGFVFSRIYLARYRSRFGASARYPRRMCCNFGGGGW